VQVAVLVENAQFNGLAITNGEFMGQPDDASEFRLRSCRW
jgi:hypothetical protein